MHPLVAGRAGSNDETLIRALRAALDERRVSTHPMTRMAYSRDASPLAIKAAADGLSPYVPRAVVWPETSAEVQAVVRLTSALQIPLVPYGGGSGIVGAALSSGDAVVIDTKRLGRVIEVDPVSMTVTVGAGIIGSVLEDQLNAQDLTSGHIRNR